MGHEITLMLLFWASCVRPCKLVGPAQDGEAARKHFGISAEPVQLMRRQKAIAGRGEAAKKPAEVLCEPKEHSVRTREPMMPMLDQASRRPALVEACDPS